MQKLEECLKWEYRIEVTPEPTIGGYSMTIPELNGCASFGDTIQECMENLECAKREWMSATLEDGGVIPQPGELEKYSGELKIRVPKTFHKSLAKHAKIEGVSLEDYCAYLLAMFDSSAF